VIVFDLGFTFLLRYEVRSFILCWYDNPCQACSTCEWRALCMCYVFTFYTHTVDNVAHCFSGYNFSRCFKA